MNWLEGTLTRYALIQNYWHSYQHYMHTLCTSGTWEIICTIIWGEWWNQQQCGHKRVSHEVYSSVDHNFWESEITATLGTLRRIVITAYVWVTSVSIQLVFALYCGPKAMNLRVDSLLPSKLTLHSMSTYTYTYTHMYHLPSFSCMHNAHYKHTLCYMRLS